MPLIEENIPLPRKLHVSSGARNLTEELVRFPYCRVCTAARDGKPGRLCVTCRRKLGNEAQARKRARRTPEQVEKDKEWDKHYQRKRHHGISEEEFNNLLATQNGRCAIGGCLEPGGKGGWHVDHCHTTGKIRGLLCHLHNIGLGCFKDSIADLESAINYLKKSN